MLNKILVAEDDVDINNLVCTYLRNSGFEAIACFDGQQALEVFNKTQFSLIISDIMMPKMDGYTLANNIRQINTLVPILFLTALDDKPSKQYSFLIGVDDYIVKPFDADLLILRIKALLRRCNINEKKEIVVGNLRMDQEEHTSYVDNNELLLTVREFDILYKLLSYPKKTFTRTQLMNEFWDYDSSATSRTVDVYMAKIREKTSSCNGFEIITVHGLGYKAILK